MNNYFRITGYCPQIDVCFIADSNGKFEKLWQFSSFLLQKGLKVLEVGNADKFLNGNIPCAEKNDKVLILRACAKGKPLTEEYKQNHIVYKAVKVATRTYIPDRTQTV